MINKIFLYGHNGSGNHGCEAIVRSTKKILGNDNIILASGGKSQDLFYKVNEILQVEDEKVPLGKLNPLYIQAYMKLKLLNDHLEVEKLEYIRTMNQVNNETLFLAIGGDNYCYPGWERYAMLHKMAKERGAKTALWSASVDPKLFTKEMADDLRSYDLIYARESLTYEALKKINDNTHLYPDVAFQLDTVNLNLPEGFIENNTIGINLSPLIMKKEQHKGATMRNYEALLQHIINKTDMQIALIPHVVWAESDDREPLSELYSKFKETGRVVLISDCNCMELKGFISRCRMFIGARTHSTIAAYSTSVPTLVVGYSIKAKGIAKDIFGTFENYVIPVQTLANQDDLINAFEWIRKNEDSIRDHLNNVMADYSKKPLRAKSEFSELVSGIHV